MEELLTPASLISLLTLSLLEIVLGIDNIIFISIVAGRLPKSQQRKARTLGLVLALVARVVLLSFITFIIGMTEPLFTILGKGFSGRDLILLGGGLFLIGKTVSEIHHILQGESLGTEEKGKGGTASFGSTIFQIILIDIVFSFDSILTAVGLSDQLPIMIAAVVISMIVMMIFSGTIAGFIERNPTIKMLALAFLVTIGILLVAEGFGQHFEKGFIYFAMAFSLGVELLNMRLRKKVKPVNLTDSQLRKLLEEREAAKE